MARRRKPLEGMVKDDPVPLRDIELLGDSFRNAIDIAARVMFRLSPKGGLTAGDLLNLREQFDSFGAVAAKIAGRYAHLTAAMEGAEMPSREEAIMALILEREGIDYEQRREELKAEIAAGQAQAALNRIRRKK